MIAKRLPSDRRAGKQITPTRSHNLQRARSAQPAQIWRRTQVRRISDWRRQICPIRADLAWDLNPASLGTAAPNLPHLCRFGVGLNPTLLGTGCAKSAPSVQIWCGTESHPTSDWLRQICPICADLVCDSIPSSFVTEGPSWVELQVPVAERMAAAGEVAMAKAAVAKAHTLRSQGRHQR